MTAEVRTARTSAEQAIVDHFDRALPSLPGGTRVRAAREAAFAIFRKTGLPHRRIEEWKYTDLRALMRTAFAPAERPTEAAARQAVAGTVEPLANIDRFRLVLVDGFFVEALSDLAGLKAAGVEVATLAALLDDDRAELLSASRLASDDVALALNTAFATDGVAIRIAPGAVIDKPIEMVHVATRGALAVRHALEVGNGATVRVIETHRGTGAFPYQSSVALGGVIGDGATVGYTKVQVDAPDALHVGTAMLALAAGAAFDHLAVTAGAAVSRSQIYLETGGDHARAGFWGAIMIGGRQHADATLVIEHATGGATTRVLYKSAIDGEAEGVFQGKVIVARDAQKTDAKMTSRALLLSENAQFSAKPELEIYADDVQCGHGATSGQIDPNELFYLMARGIPRNEAEQLLVEAFLADGIDRQGDGVIAAPLKVLIGQWLANRGLAKRGGAP
jgi:Fe-S cluster assembly protein SufD